MAKIKLVKIVEEWEASIDLVRDTIGKFGSTEKAEFDKKLEINLYDRDWCGDNRINYNSPSTGKAIVTTYTELYGGPEITA